MEMEKRKNKRVMREEEESERVKNKRLKGVEEEDGSDGGVPTEEEVEEFFAILRRMRVAVKYFDDKGSGKTVDQLIILFLLVHIKKSVTLNVIYCRSFLIGVLMCYYTPSFNNFYILLQIFKNSHVLVTIANIF